MDRLPGRLARAVGPVRGRDRLPRRNIPGRSARAFGRARFLLGRGGAMGDPLWTADGRPCACWPAVTGRCRNSCIALRLGRCAGGSAGHGRRGPGRDPPHLRTVGRHRTSPRESTATPSRSTCGSCSVADVAEVHLREPGAGRRGRDGPSTQRHPVRSAGRGRAGPDVRRDPRGLDREDAWQAALNQAPDPGSAPVRSPSWMLC